MLTVFITACVAAALIKAGAIATFFIKDAIREGQQ